MKLKKIVVSCISIGLGLVSVAALAATDYFPPERLLCKVDNASNLTCSDFNRKYLMEYTHTADFPAGKEIVFTFSSGTAYFTSQHEWSVFFTYKNTTGKNIRLTSVNTTIHPNIDVGAWKKHPDFYTCTAGYMSCPITNLPAAK